MPASPDFPLPFPFHHLYLSIHPQASNNQLGFTCNFYHVMDTTHGSMEDLSDATPMGTLSGSHSPQSVLSRSRQPTPQMQTHHSHSYSDHTGPESEDEDHSANLIPSHHAMYRPLVTNPIACLEAGGGNAESLPRVPPERSSKRTRQFYVDQNASIDSFREMDEVRRKVHGGEAIDEEVDSFPVMMGIRLSFLANVIILGVKVILVLRTGSVAFVASLLDSVLDIISGLTLVVTNKLLSKQNRHKYPLGKQTFEPLGTLVFSACMFTASFQLIQYSIEVLINATNEVSFDLFSGIFIGSIIFCKFLLMVYCWRNQGLAPSLEALAQDHRNDVISNVIGTGAALLSMQTWKGVDPVVALLLTFYIMYSWARTGVEQIMMLSGKSASPEVLKKITYCAQNHHSAILFVDTVRAVAIGGSGYQVEVDIVLPPTMELREAHDIGESLQLVLEKTEDISRAYVHLDYEFNHCPWDHR